MNIEKLTPEEQHNLIADALLSKLYAKYIENEFKPIIEDFNEFTNSNIVSNIINEFEEIYDLSLKYCFVMTVLKTFHNKITTLIHD